MRSTRFCVTAAALAFVLGGCGSSSTGTSAAQQGGFWDDFWNQNIGGEGGAGVSPDSDGDGLSDAKENQLGSDPNNKDTDGDGWLDGEEVDGFTDPVDSSDHPYTGGWAMGACRHDIESTGNLVGDVAEQFELEDQFGDTVRLHDFCDREVLLVGAGDN